jgi:hypothetical protein
MDTIKQFSKKLQERTAKMNREVLFTLFIVFGALGSGACFLVVYKALAHPTPLNKVWPLKHDSIIIQTQPK